jgi:hypothetical protein
MGAATSARMKQQDTTASKGPNMPTSTGKDVQTLAIPWASRRMLVFPVGPKVEKDETSAVPGTCVGEAAQAASVSSLGGQRNLERGRVDSRFTPQRFQRLDAEAGRAQPL